MANSKQREVFRQDTPAIRPVAEKSKAVLNAARKLHMHISGGMPGTRLRKDSVESNLQALRDAIEALELQLAKESLSTEQRGELTFF